MLRPLRISAFVVLVNVIASATVAGTFQASVDATQIHRHLLLGTAEYAVKSGTFELFYPQWIPGIHAPENPVRNLAEITVATPDGQAVPWNRDVRDVFRFHVHVPSNAQKIVVKTTYICDQPTTNSIGIDSYGNSLLGVINWNTVLLYPASEKVIDTTVDLSLTLPDGWKWGSSLVGKSEDGNWVNFEPVSFEELIDSPLICGKNFKTVDITPDGEAKKHFFHLVSESEKAVQLDEVRTRKMKNLVKEALALFGGAHYDSYHLLLVLSDSVPYIGLEHMRSSLNAVGERSLLDDNAIPEVLAHEYTHSWCGKYHIPAGMITPHFNTPKDTHLLWVYEGLDQYLGKLVYIRSGANTTKEKTAFEAALEDLGEMFLYNRAQKGRRSISLEDTATSSYIRRGGSKHWRSLNRGQEYYNEGAMLWMEIDAILRASTDGKKSLSDFCREFLGRHGDSRQYVGYTEDDIVRILNEIHPYDWQTLIANRVRELKPDLSLDFLDRCGYRIEYSNKQTNYDKDSTFTSIGMRTDDGGRITSIVPGGPADRTGLYEGAVIVGVNDRKFSKKRLEDAVAGSAMTSKITLLLLNGELFETKVIDYADGPKYLDLVRNEDKPDRLKEIWKPLVVDPKEQEKRAE